MEPAVSFEITEMEAAIPEGIDFVWNGSRFNSGPLQVRLDRQAREEGDNSGELDFDTNVARARFNLAIDMSGVAKRVAGSQCDWVRPMRAVLDAEGVITEDHNFGFSGPMNIHPHLFAGTGQISALV